MDIYGMRHGLKGKGDNPPLTARGEEQMHEAIQKHLVGIGIKKIFCGNLRRHVEGADIAQRILNCHSYQLTDLLTLDGIHGLEDINRCVAESSNHPGGTEMGFRVDNWFELNPELMLDLEERFVEFTGFAMSRTARTGAILAISSSPLIEAATPKPDETWLLDEAGIIKYTLDDSWQIVEHKIIFDGFSN